MNIQNSTKSIQATAQSTDYKITVMEDNLRAKELGNYHNPCSGPLILLTRAHGEHKAMMQWLSPIDPCENHEAATSAHQEGTGTWFFESNEFTEWYQAKSSFLWLSGFRKFASDAKLITFQTNRTPSAAGAGKTILLYETA